MKKILAAIAAQIASFFSAPEKKETVSNRLIAAGDKKIQFRSRRGNVRTAKIRRRAGQAFEVERKGMHFTV